MLRGFGRVDRDDAGVGMRAAQDAAVDQNPEVDVGAVLRLACDLFGAIRANWAGAMTL